ncbi:hypothetical protein [Sinorhizobium sp. BJ1]|uniref:hypothetical protein n=1 Tax=Sinorhizobium sp. BJ1 TaxID=2035455 RepID=UPI000BE9D15C|nr:hypothetical protein [Sinorhizobium sp. BJ1]PDT81800.1 hypothetical protein CO676_19715 [Sinorhizobium sp. BJ1]
MSDQDQHNRTMNLNAHYAWSFALWASAEAARTSGNLVLAPIGYYYSVFHSAYAYLNAVPGIAPTTFDRMGHQPLSNLIEQHLGSDLQKDFDEMRDLREAINYLGMGSAEGKLRVLRGHPLRFGTPSQSASLDNMISRARNKSRDFIITTLDRVAALPSQAADTFPKRGDDDENWLLEYMQEDIYLGLMSDDMRGKAVRIVRELLA